MLPAAPVEIHRSRSPDMGSGMQRRGSPPDPAAYTHPRSVVWSWRASHRSYQAGATPQSVQSRSTGAEGSARVAHRALMRAQQLGCGVEPAAQGAVYGAPVPAGAGVLAGEIQRVIQRL